MPAEDDADVPEFNWRGRIGNMAYGLQFERELDERLARWSANQILTGKGYVLEPEAYVRAIEIALAQSEPLNLGIEKRHSDEEFRAFLAMIHAALINS